MKNKNIFGKTYNRVYSIASYIIVAPNRQTALNLARRAWIPNSTELRVVSKARSLRKPNVYQEI